MSPWPCKARGTASRTCRACVTEIRILVVWKYFRIARRRLSPAGDSRLYCSGTSRVHLRRSYTLCRCFFDAIMVLAAERLRVRSLQLIDATRVLVRSALLGVRRLRRVVRNCVPATRPIAARGSAARRRGRAGCNCRVVSTVLGRCASLLIGEENQKGETNE